MTNELYKYVSRKYKLPNEYFYNNKLNVYRYIYKLFSI